MARCKLSVEEQIKRNWEDQRKRRQRIDSDPNSRRDNLEKERQRWKNRVQNKKVRNIGELGPREQRHCRKYWRKAQKRSRRSRAVKNARQEVDTPPDSPLEQRSPTFFEPRTGSVSEIIFTDRQYKLRNKYDVMQLYEGHKVPKLQLIITPN